MEKTIYIAQNNDTNDGGVWQDEIVTYERDEAVKKAEYIKARLTASELKHTEVYVGVYTVDVPDGDPRSAGETYKDMLANDTWPLDHDAIEV